MADSSAPPIGTTKLTFVKDMPVGTTKQLAFDGFFKYTWIGGNVGTVYPIIVEEGDPLTREGCLRRILNIEEKIVESRRPDRVIYRVQNPGYSTYQVDYHLGTVTFEQLPGSGGSDEIVRIVWEIVIRPLPLCGVLVKAVTKAIINMYLSRLARSLQKRDRDTS